MYQQQSLTPFVNPKPPKKPQLKIYRTNYTVKKKEQWNTHLLVERADTLQKIWWTVIDILRRSGFNSERQYFGTGFLAS